MRTKFERIAKPRVSRANLKSEMRRSISASPHRVSESEFNPVVPTGVTSDLNSAHDSTTQVSQGRSLLTSTACWCIS